ncbi:MAG: helix-turn-helix domain-containing protein [Acidobacteriota bacterium]
MRKDPFGGRRSNCPVNFAVETIGDKWSLVILRDIIFWGKRSYGEFLKSDEKIATNILAGRLEYLEREGLISKTQDPSDKRKEIYTVTDRGLDMVPMFVEMIAWSAGDPTWQAIAMNGKATPPQVRFVQRTTTTKNKRRLVEEVREAVRNGGSVFGGVLRPGLIGA